VWDCDADFEDELIEILFLAEHADEGPVAIGFLPFGEVDLLLVDL
jgi:hypothetical protein